MKKILKLLFPVGSLQRRITAKILRRLGVISEKSTVEYYDYFTTLTHSQIPMYPAGHKEDILFSIVIPAYNTPEKYLRPLLASITAQTYMHWELIIVDASTDPAASERIIRATSGDSRIKVTKIKNQGIAANTNKAIEHASGEYVVFADHDDVFDVQALNEVRKALDARPKAGLLYSDEDKLSEDGKRYFGPHFKPDWSPDLATSVNYVTHLTVIKKSVLEKVGVLDPKKDGAQDYDLLLRVADSGAEIVHIPKVLYHWREADHSTARDISNKPHALTAGIESIKEHLERQGIAGAKVIERAKRPGFYEVIYKPSPKVSVIFTQFASAKVLTAYIDRMLTRTNTEGLSVEFVIPENAHPTLQKDSRISLRKVAVVSYTADALKGAHDCTVWITKLAMPEHADWLKKLSGLSGVGRIAAAAPVIIDDTGCVNDSGFVYESNRLIPLFLGTPFTDNPTYFGNTEWCRDVDALSGAVTVLRKEAAQVCIKLMKDDDFGAAVHRYSHEKARGDTYACIWTNVVFNDLTVTSMASRTTDYSGKQRFNPSLITYGNMFHIRASEEVLLNRLMRLPVEDKTYE